MRGDAHAEREDVPPGDHGSLLLRQARNVVGVVEPPLAIERDIASSQGADAHEARPARRGRLDAPVDVQRRAVRLDAREDPAVDDGDQVRVRHGIQQVARERPVDAREDQVAVEGGGVSGLVEDRRLDQAQVEGRGRVAQGRRPPGDRHLRQPGRDVGRQRRVRAVEVPRLEAVVVDVRQARQARPAARLGDQTPHVAEADDAEPRPAEVLVRRPAPDRQRPVSR